MSEFIEEEKAGAQAIADLMAGKKTIVVAGAGMSTDAGIPDYRGTGSSGMPTVDMDQFLGQLYWQKWVWRRNQETWKTVARKMECGAFWERIPKASNGIRKG